MTAKKYGQDIKDQIQALKTEGVPSKEIAARLNVPLFLVKRNGKYTDHNLVKRNVRDGILKISDARTVNIKKYWNSAEGKERASKRAIEFWANLEATGTRELFIRDRNEAYLKSGAVERWREETMEKCIAAARAYCLKGEASFQARCERLATEHGGKVFGAYVNTKTAMEWECSKGHRWVAPPGSVFNGHWCIICARVGPSIEQLAIYEYIKTFAPDAVLGNRSVLVNPATGNKLELDIYVPSKNFGFEFNGLIFHSDYFHRIPLRHQRKAQAARTAGIKLLAVFEDEWEAKPELIKAMIRYRLGVLPETKLRASKCEVRKLDANVQFEAFFDRNHLDGHARANMAYGLFFEGRLVSCLSIRTNHQKETEIARLATDYDVHVYGGASKLIKAALVDHPVLVTFSNNRLSSGDVYRNMGATFLQENRPSYWYTEGNERVWRYKCRRINDPDILAKFPDVPHTEKGQALGGVIGYALWGTPTPLYKIEDYGHLKWIFGAPTP